MSYSMRLGDAVAVALTNFDRYETLLRGVANFRTNIVGGATPLQPETLLRLTQQELTNLISPYLVKGNQIFRPEGGFAAFLRIGMERVAQLKTSSWLDSKCEGSREERVTGSGIPRLLIPGFELAPEDQRDDNDSTNVSDAGFGTRLHRVLKAKSELQFYPESSWQKDSPVMKLTSSVLSWAGSDAVLYRRTFSSLTSTMAGMLNEDSTARIYPEVMFRAGSLVGTPDLVGYSEVNDVVTIGEMKSYTPGVAATLQAMFYALLVWKTINEGETSTFWSREGSLDTLTSGVPLTGVTNLALSGRGDWLGYSIPNQDLPSLWETIWSWAGDEDIEERVTDLLSNYSLPHNRRMVVGGSSW